MALQGASLLKSPKAAMWPKVSTQEIKDSREQFVMKFTTKMKVKKRHYTPRHSFEFCVVFLSKYDLLTYLEPWGYEGQTKCVVEWQSAILQGAAKGIDREAVDKVKGRAQLDVVEDGPL